MSTPDDVVQMGPLRMERHGRVIMLSNNASPEQHREMLRRSATANQEILAELDAKVRELQAHIAKFDPLDLMFQAACAMLHLMMKHQSEGDYAAAEVHVMPGLEYVQYLIARTPISTTKEALTDEEWSRIWEDTRKLIDLTNSYLMTRGMPHDPPSPTDELRFSLDLRRLIIRVQRYPLFLRPYLESTLLPYSQNMVAAYGIDAAQAIEQLMRISEHQRTGIFDRNIAMFELQRTITSKLAEKGLEIREGLSPQEQEQIRLEMESEEMIPLQEEMHELMRQTMTPALFDISDMTTLPPVFLSMLSVKPGESILTRLTGPNHDDLSPLSDSVLHYKPFLEADGKYYYFLHTGFEDRLADIVEDDLFKKQPGNVSDMAKRRSDRLESDAIAMLVDILRPDFSHQSVYYPNPDEPGNLTELDGLIGVGDVLILVEAKAGGLSRAASRGAPESLEQEMSDLIIEGQRQSERAEKYIRSASRAPFFDQTGVNEIRAVERDRYRKIFRIVITKEDLGWVGARIAVLSLLDPSLSNSYPWHISIEDLRPVSQLFQGDGIRFVHYLEKRLAASAETGLSQTDELDHVGLYHEINSYHDFPVAGVDRMTYDSSYMANINKYFMALSAGEPAVVPRQSMSPMLTQVVDALNRTSSPHRFEIGSMILDLGADGRKNFEGGLTHLRQMREQGRFFNIRMGVGGGVYGVTATYARNANWQAELKLSMVHLELSGCSRWAVIQLANAPGIQITDLDVLMPGRFSDEELVTSRAKWEAQVQAQITSRRPNRNDRCPCLSGKKFKICHGQR